MSTEKTTSSERYAEFLDLANKVGNVSYDMKKSFTHYAGFLEALMGGMFCELDDTVKAYYIKRMRDKLFELEAERFEMAKEAMEKANLLSEIND